MVYGDLCIKSLTDGLMYLKPPNNQELEKIDTDRSSNTHLNIKLKYLLQGGTMTVSCKSSGQMMMNVNTHLITNHDSCAVRKFLHDFYHFGNYDKILSDNCDKILSDNYDNILSVNNEN